MNSWPMERPGYHQVRTAAGLLRHGFHEANLGLVRRFHAAAPGWPDSVACIVFWSSLITCTMWRLRGGIGDLEDVLARRKHLTARQLERCAEGEVGDLVGWLLAPAQRLQQMRLPAPTRWPLRVWCGSYEFVSSKLLDARSTRVRSYLYRKEKQTVCLLGLEGLVEQVGLAGRLGCLTRLSRRS